MMILRPTRGGLLFLTACIAAVGVALMNVGLITALVASVFCAFLLSSLLFSFFAALGYKVVRHIAEEGACNEDLCLKLTVKNVFPWFRQDCVILEYLPFCAGKKIAFEVPCLRPGESMELERKVRAVKRGHFHLQKLYLVTGDPMGLFAVRRRYSLPGEVLIVPKVEPLGDFKTDGKGGDSFTHEGRLTGHAGLGNDFFGVRPYRAGDEMRHIHWRLSASKGRLMVREFEALTVDHVTLVLDTEKKLIGCDEMENNFEKLLSLAASLTFFLAKRSCALTVLVRYNDYGVTQLSGDASSIRMKVLSLLTELAGTAGTLHDLITENLELFPEGGTVCLLSMSRGKDLHDAVRFLEDKDSRVIHFYAPKECFPYVPEDEPVEFVLPEKEDAPGVSCEILLTCQSSFEELKICYEQE